MEFGSALLSAVLQFKDALLVILGGLVSLLGTMLVESRRVENELRIKAFTGTLASLEKARDAVSAIASQVGAFAWIDWLHSDQDLSAHAEELKRLSRRISVLAGSLRRFKRLSRELHNFANTSGFLLRELRPDSCLRGPFPKLDRDIQFELDRASFRICALTEVIIDNGLRSDFSVKGALRPGWFRLRRWLKARFSRTPQRPPGPPAVPDVTSPPA